MPPLWCAVILRGVTPKNLLLSEYLQEISHLHSRWQQKFLTCVRNDNRNILNETQWSEESPTIERMAGDSSCALGMTWLSFWMKRSEVKNLSPSERYCMRSLTPSVAGSRWHKDPSHSLGITYRGRFIVGLTPLLGMVSVTGGKIMTFENLVPQKKSLQVYLKKKNWYI